LFKCLYNSYETVLTKENWAKVSLMSEPWLAKSCSFDHQRQDLEKSNLARSWAFPGTCTCRQGNWQWFVFQESAKWREVLWCGIHKVEWDLVCVFVLLTTVECWGELMNWDIQKTWLVAVKFQMYSFY